MSAIDAATMYALLAPLKKGDAVPGDLFIADYKDRTRPPWTIFERQDLPADGIRLELEDASNGDLFGCVHLIILAFPAKILRTPPQYWDRDTPAIIGSQLCDMLQQGRNAQKEADHDPQP